MSVAASRLLRVRTDAALLRRFRAGDDTAFGALHARYVDAVRSYAAFMLRGSVHDPEDAAQDVFLRAYQSLRRDERDIDVRPWLFRIAHNRCIDILRRPVSDEIHDGTALSRGAVASTDPVAAIEQRETMRALLRDIGALTEGQRSALLLRELGGLSHEAVAEALGITTTSSRMLLHRARTALTDAAEARETTCRDVRDRLVAATDGAIKLARRDRRHLTHCSDCRAFHRAHARVERELSLLAPAGLGIGALIKLLGGGSAAGGGGVAATASSSSLLSGTTAKLTVGACCALLAGGGAAAEVKNATTHHKPRDARAQQAQRQAPAPGRSAAVAPGGRTATASMPPTRTTTTDSPVGHRDKRATTTGAATTTRSDSPTAAPPAHENPTTSVDLAALNDGAATTPASTTPSKTPPGPHTTIDLADFDGG